MESGQQIARFPLLFSGSPGRPVLPVSGGCVAPAISPPATAALLPWRLHRNPASRLPVWNSRGRRSSTETGMRRGNSIAPERDRGVVALSGPKKIQFRPCHGEELNTNADRCSRLILGSPK
jgi:hypothetical protein